MFLPEHPDEISDVAGIADRENVAASDFFMKFLLEVVIFDVFYCVDYFI